MFWFNGLGILLYIYVNSLLKCQMELKNLLCSKCTTINFMAKYLIKFNYASKSV